MYGIRSSRHLASISAYLNDRFQSIRGSSVAAFASANVLGLARHEDEVVAHLETELVQASGRQIVRIVPSDQVGDEAFTYPIRDVAVQVIPTVEIELGGQVAVLRMPNLHMQVGRAKEMPSESVPHDPRRTPLRDLIARWNDRPHLERAVGTGMEAAAQVPVRDAGMDVQGPRRPTATCPTRRRPAACHQVT